LPIVIARVDDRLVHGQITCSWVNRLKVTRIIVANDKVATTPLLAGMLPYAAPLAANVKIGALTLKDAVNQYTSGGYQEDNVMLIAENAQDMLTLLQNGIKLDWVCLGQTGGKAGRKQSIQAFSASDEEAKIYREIAKHVNGKMIYQQVAEEKPMDFLPLLNKVYPEKT